MKITKKSDLTGLIHTLEINITEEQLIELRSKPRRLIQQICPQLNSDDREFLLSGITKEEWEKEFGDVE